MDIKTPDALYSLVDVLRTKGVLYFRSGDLELTLAPEYKEPEEPMDVGSRRDRQAWRGYSLEQLEALGASD